MSNNIAVLASTSGTDLQAIIDSIEEGKLDATIKIVISNNRDCFALERARRHHIPAVFLDPIGKRKEEYDREIAGLLEKNKVELILLIGYMKLLSNWFVDKYRNQVMNIHPSLLPSFAGGMDLNVHEAVLARGCKVTGASLIFIDEGADTGPIISQRVVRVEKDETAQSLKEKVQKVEQQLLLEAIPLFLKGKLAVQGNKVIRK